MYKCEYCKKSFKRENTIAVHMCEQKRRALSAKDPQVIVGYQSYIFWNKIAMGAKVPKTYDQFSTSSYYAAFVKFGGYVRSVRDINHEDYIKWLTLNRVKLIDWCKDSVYKQYLKDASKKESVDRAVERFILLADKWAETHDSHWQDYWKSASINLIISHISTGKISPWILYASDQAQNFLDSVPAEILQDVVNTIDPEFWIRKMKLYPEDVEFIRRTIG